MTAEENASLVRRYFSECVSAASGPDPQRALSTLDELLTDDFVMFYNNETETEGARGRERHKQFLVNHARGYPNDRWTIEALVADDEEAACWWRIEAEHATTGNPIDVRAGDFYRFVGGRISELRRFLDFKSLDEQAGLAGADR